jgi:phosphoribosylanthranilate isomerase
MSLHIKICGITDPGDALTAAAAGADAVGFVFFGGSPRRISPAEAAAIADELPESVEKVAVFLRPTPAEIEAVLDVFGADLVQADHQCLNGSLDVPYLPVYREGDDIFSDLSTHRVSRFLYEGRRSGMGETVDWEAASRIAMAGRMTLAGGLNADNVAEAIQRVRPDGVDVSSGVESMPGVKDVGLIGEFIERARETEKGIQAT